MSDTYLLDTCMIPHIFDSRQENMPDSKTVKFRSRYNAIRSEHILICAIVSGEVEYGLRVAFPKEPQKQQSVQQIMSTFPIILQISRETAIPYYAQIRANLFNKYAERDKRFAGPKQKFVEQLMEPATCMQLGIQENDLWIASVAMQYNLVLVTGDKLMRIREIMPDLRIENWLE